VTFFILDIVKGDDQRANQNKGLPRLGEMRFQSGKYFTKNQHHRRKHHKGLIISDIHSSNYQHLPGGKTQNTLHIIKI
jgi:hypothetical protein